MPRPTSSIASASIRRAAASSSSVLTIGNITLIGWSCATRTIAEQLLGEQRRVGQRQPEAPHPEERVGLAGIGR